MASPVLNAPVVVPGGSEVVTVTKPTLNCTQVGMTNFAIQWRPKPDSTMGDPMVMMILSPYDKNANMCAPSTTRLTTSSMGDLVVALATAGRPACANAMQAIYDMMEDIANNGIPAGVIQTLNTAERAARKPITFFSKGF